MNGPIELKQGRAVALRPPRALPARTARFEAGTRRELAYTLFRPARARQGHRSAMSLPDNSPYEQHPITPPR